MNSMRPLLLTLALCVSLAAASLAHVAAQQPVTWRMAYVPVPNSSYQKLIESIPGRTAMATGNRVRVEFPRAAPAPAEYVAAVRDGRLEAASLVASSYRSELPILSIATLPGLFRSIDEYRRLTDKVLFPAFARILRERYQLVYMAGGTLPGVVVFSKIPIRKPDDLAGMRIRVPDAYTAEHVSTLRGAPSRIPGSEVLVALERGVIDATMTSSNAWQPELAGVAKYAVDWPAANIVPWAIIVSERAWNLLTTDLQARLVSEFRRIQDEGFEEAIREQQQAEEALRKRFMYASFSRTEAARITDPKLLESTYKGWAELNRKQGVDGEGLLERVQETAAGGTGGGGDPCYYPTCKCNDGSCKKDCCK